MVKIARTIDQSYQTKINKSIIFNYLRENQPVSRIKISKDLKISASAVTRLVASLVDQRYIIETKKEKTKVGKKPILLEINGEKGCFVALDLSQTKLRVSINDFSGRILDDYSSFDISNTTDIIPKLTDELDNIFKKYSSAGSLKYKDIEVKGISIGIPADVDVKTSKIISASLYESWYELNFKNIFENKYKIPVYVEKDAYLSVLAEKYFGGGKGFKDIVFIEISSGVGAGIIINNEILRGINNSAGQIAFLFSDNKDSGHQAGNIGYLDKHASYQSFTDEMVNMIKNGARSSIQEVVKDSLNQITTQMIFSAAKEGDKLSLDIINKKVKLLAKVIVNITLILNPQIIIVGGNITNCVDIEVLLIDKIIEIVRKIIPFTLPIIKPSLLKNNVVLLGASLFAIEKSIVKEFPYEI